MDFFSLRHYKFKTVQIIIIMCYAGQVLGAVGYLHNQYRTEI